MNKYKGIQNYLSLRYNTNISLGGNIKLLTFTTQQKYFLGSRDQRLEISYI